MRGDLFGPFLVTLFYLGWYYVLMLRVLRVRVELAREYHARGERFDRYRSQDPRMLAADRAQLNMLEHMPPFLVLFWLNVWWVGGAFTTLLGGVYLGARLLHPLMLGTKLGRGLKNRILIATLPGYLVIVVLGARLLLAVLGGES